MFWFLIAFGWCDWMLCLLFIYFCLFKCEHIFWMRVDGGSVSLPGVIAKNGLPTSIDFDKKTYFMAENVLDKCNLVASKPRALGLCVHPIIQEWPIALYLLSTYRWFTSNVTTWNWSGNLGPQWNWVWNLLCDGLKEINTWTFEIIWRKQATILCFLHEWMLWAQLSFLAVKELSALHFLFILLPIHRESLCASSLFSEQRSPYKSGVK